MKLIPVITEKSTGDAKGGKYTFFVDCGLTKHQIKDLIGRTFSVDVIKVRTINLKGKRKKTIRGRFRIIKPRKKAIVELKGDQKIDLFEEKKK